MERVVGRMYAAGMAAQARYGAMWEPGAITADGRRVRVRRGASEGRFAFARWAVAICLAALAIFLAWDGYKTAAGSNREGVFGVAFGVGLVVFGLVWFR